MNRYSLMRKFTPPAPVAVETLLLQVSPTGDVGEPTGGVGAGDVGA